MLRYVRPIVYVYAIVSMFFMGVFLLLSIYAAIHGRTMRAQLPNGAYVNRAHPFSDRIVLRAPDGEIVARDLAYVVFNDGYVAGATYETPYSTERFIYKLGDDRAFRDWADPKNLFAKMLADSGLEAQWPWGYEDPERLDWDGFLTRYSRAWHE